jgi:hypothetical protein
VREADLYEREQRHDDEQLRDAMMELNRQNHEFVREQNDEVVVFEG